MPRQRVDRQRKPSVIDDPTGERHGGLPTYRWGEAPDGLLTRRQLAAKGLRKAGQSPCAQMRRGRRLFAYLYDVQLAKPQFTKTEAKLAAVWTAARSRQCCPTCKRRDLGYIPSTAAPASGDCEECWRAREARLARPAA
jgi:hypothetical protein